MHLVGFTIRIYHDARSPERQNRKKRVHCELTISSEQCNSGLTLVTGFYTTNWKQQRYCCEWYKDEVSLVHTMTAQEASRGTVLIILNLGTRWKCVVNFMPRPSYHIKTSTLYPNNRSLCGPHSWSGRFEEKNFLHSKEISKKTSPLCGLKCFLN